MSEELASLKYRRRQVEDELQLKAKAFKEAVKHFNDQDKKLKVDKHRHLDKIHAMQQLIDLE